MKQIQRHLFSLLAFLILTLFSLPVLAGNSQFQRNMCSEKDTEVCVLNAYNSYWHKHHNLDQWNRQRLACERDYLRRASWWGKYYKKYPMARILGQGPERADAKEQIGCVNALVRMRGHEQYVLIGGPDAKFRAQRMAEAKAREALRRQEEVTRLRPIDPSRLPKPQPVADAKPEPVKRPLKPGEANMLLAQIGADTAATSAAPAGKALSRSRTAITSRPKSDNTTVRTRRDVVRQRHEQYVARHGKTAQAPKSVKAAQASSDKPRINCVPEHVSIRKIEADGSLVLYNDTGADWLRYGYCFPDHDLDAKSVAENNKFKATIVYAYDSAKPLNRQKLTFSERRWKLKRDEWDLSGKEAYKDFFAEHKDDAIGIALQGKQILKLTVSNSPNKTTTTDSAAKSGSEPAKGEGAGLQKSGEESSVRYAVAGSDSCNVLSVRDSAQSDCCMRFDWHDSEAYARPGRAQKGAGNAAEQKASRRAWHDDAARGPPLGGNILVHSESFDLHSEFCSFHSDKMTGYVFM